MGKKDKIVKLAFPPRERPSCGQKLGKIWQKAIGARIPQVQPPKLSIFPYNDSLQNRISAITFFGQTYIPS
jgi:hypothetical protein